MEGVGTYLSLSQDSEVFASFQDALSALFSCSGQSTFVRQAANLWAIKERLWMTLRDQLIRHDELVGIIDSMPIPVCRDFARAPSGASAMAKRMRRR